MRILLLAALLLPLGVSGQIRGRVHSPGDIRTGQHLADWSQTKLYLREATGNNDGPELDRYCRALGIPLHSYWCGAYQAEGQRVLHLPVPAGAGAARNWKVPSRTFYQLGSFGTMDSTKAGDRFMFYYSNLGRIGHIGMALAPGRSKRKGRPARGWTSNEGNTGTGGGRDGAGVHNLFRANQDVYAAANWSH